MADEKKAINSVTTFVAEVHRHTLADALAKFAGRHTPRTLRAAQRVAAKKTRVKIPRNLLRQVWRLTGGWKDGHLLPGWPPEEKIQGGQLPWIQVGGLEVFFCLDPQNQGRLRAALLRFRGLQIAGVRYNQAGDYAGYSTWRDEARVKNLVNTLPQKER